MSRLPPQLPSKLLKEVLLVEDDGGYGEVRFWVRGVLARLPGSTLSPYARRCTEPLSWAICLHSPPSLCPALKRMGYYPHLAEVETEAQNSEMTSSRLLW